MKSFLKSELKSLNLSQILNLMQEFCEFQTPQVGYLMYLANDLVIYV